MLASHASKAGFQSPLILNKEQSKLSRKQWQSLFEKVKVKSGRETDYSSSLSLVNGKREEEQRCKYKLPLENIEQAVRTDTIARSLCQPCVL